jgi:hypothetical protein
MIARTTGFHEGLDAALSLSCDDVSSSTCVLKYKACELSSNSTDDAQPRTASRSLAVVRKNSKFGLLYVQKHTGLKMVAMCHLSILASL